MQFRRDVYDIDRRQTILLADRLSRLRKSAAAAASAGIRTGTSGAVTAPSSIE
jgi:hypothetical protein